MIEITSLLKKIQLPNKASHKGQNGRLLIIGGSNLFHAASLWSLKVASRIVDLVHYSSVDQNNKIVQKLKEEFRDGIVVPRSTIEDYIMEDDCVLIGPGMVRVEKSKIKDQKSQPKADQPRAEKPQSKIQNIKDIEEIEDEGVQTYYLTKYLLTKYPKKKWVIDAGALQMMEPEWIPKGAILTPHKREFENILSKFSIFNFPASPAGRQFSMNDKNINFQKQYQEAIKIFANKYKCTVLLKGETDYIASKNNFIEIKGGNAGMTKGGTGDVLAGLVAAFYCKNDAFTSAVAASYINKKAGEDLYQKSGYWFNASDLADQIPRTMKKLLI